MGPRWRSQPRPGRLAALVQPVLVGRTGAPGNQVRQTREHLPVPIAGEFDHPGQLLRTPAAVLDRLGRDVVPHVFIDPEDPHAPANSDGSWSITSGSGLIESHTMRQPGPSWRRIPLTLA